MLNVVPGHGPDVGAPIGRHPDIDAVTFTGSNEVGALFLKYASESNLKPVGLEMGGKSPFIVLDDTEISDDLVDNAVNAAFWNAGQNCSANMRQIIHRSRKDEFTAKVLARVGALRVGDPLDPRTEIGPLVSQEQQSRVLGFIKSGRDQGARLLAGGSGSSRDWLLRRADRVRWAGRAMTIAREEIFGPVLGMLEVDSLEGALAMANDTEYGLHATVYTRDIDRAVHFARRLACGTVAINGFTEGDVKTPFGGYRRSGSLARDKGLEAASQYLQTKTIWIRSRAP